MLDDRSSPCYPSVIVELLDTVSVLIAHLADPLTANDLILCVDIFLQVLTINHRPQEAAILGLTACICRCADLSDYLVGRPALASLPP
jgi:hypothetical protein